jgi:hypothetical protein
MDRLACERGPIRGAAVVGSAPFLAMSGFSAAACTQERVAHQDRPYFDRRCGNCTHFIKPHLSQGLKQGLDHRAGLKRRSG